MVGIPHTRYSSKLLICLFLLGAIFVAYGQVINFDFVGFDDELYVTANRHVQSGISFEGIVWAFRTSLGSWHPLTWLSHMLDSQLYGLVPFGHHLVNLLFHILNSFLLFWILQQMTGALWRCAFVAGLFALHPLHVESVAWVASRKDLLSTFFFFLSVAAYYQYTQKRKIINYVVVIFLLIMGLMAKPMLVTFPFVLLLLDYWPLGRIQNGQYPYHYNTIEEIRHYAKQFLQLLWEKIPLFITVGFAIVVTYTSQYHDGAVVPLDVFPPGVRISNAIVAYATYVLKTVNPIHLSVFYPHPGNNLPVWQILGSTLLIAALILFAIRSARRLPYVLVGLFWYLGTLVPVIGIVQVGAQAIADRYTYIPLIGLFIIGAWGLSDLLGKFRYQKHIFVGAAIIVLSAITALTYFQVRHWENEVTLFKHAIRINPDNSMAHTNIAIALSEAGKFDEAEFHLKEVLRINPQNAKAEFYLGNVMYATGNFDKAAFYYRQTLKINPAHSAAHNNLAKLLYHQGDLDAAAIQMAEAIRINPGDADAHNNFAIIKSAQGKTEEAIFHYTEAIKIKPEHAIAHCNLGTLLISRGKLKEAGNHFFEAIKIKPDYAAAYYQIGMILDRQGKAKQADIFFIKAIQLDPTMLKIKNR